MSEVIELTDKDLEIGSQGTFFGWFLMETLGAYLDASKSPWTFGQRLEVSLTINGHEMPLRPVVKMIEENLDNLVARKAEELLQDKLDKVRNAIEDIDRHVHSQCLELGLVSRE
jgi:hypothetical protein